MSVAIEKATGQEFAVKVVAIPEQGKAVDSNKPTLEDIFREIDILAGLDHPHVITLREFFVENGQVTTMCLLDSCRCHNSLKPPAKIMMLCTRSARDMSSCACSTGVPDN